ncbi:MAG: hypothetical protein IJT50_17235 [Lentisphaeria bacterium]|nr:hypothetical protein [Lentisphaeria bacterium]
MKRFQVRVSNSTPGGKIRKINGGNLGPVMNAAAHPYGDTRQEFAALNIPLTRLHDAPYENPARHLVDVPMIFPNMKDDAEDPDNYFFAETDDYIGDILECGTQVMYRLGVSIEHGLRRYYLKPPEDVEKYAAVCANIIRHMNEGKWNGHHFDIRYWEIWNEPENWDGNDDKQPFQPRQWDGTLEEFNEFYCKLAGKLKSLFPHLMIGGPSHGAPLKCGKEFLEYCKKNEAPLDFYTCHCYSDSVERYRDLVFTVRKMMDEAGFPDAELHLNEWHYHPPYPKDHPTYTLAERRVFLSKYYDESKGLDSAAMLCAVMTAWQDAPIDMGGYYTTGGTGGYGIYSGVYVPTPSYFGLKAFGEIVRFPERVRCESEAPVYALAGKNDAGEHALLVSIYRKGTDSGRVEVTFDTPVEIRQVELLDETHSLEKIAFEAEPLSLPVDFKGNSGVFLVKYVPKQ